MKRLLGQPIAHFFAIGAALFLLHSRVAPPANPRTLTVTQADVNALVQEHIRTHGNAPTAEEHRALVAQYIREEVLFREAVAMGLHLGDVVVRRRLIQTMEFLAEGAAPMAEPSDGDLSGYLAAHASEYRVPAQVTLVHVFASRERHPADLRAVALAWKAELDGGAAEKHVGDPFLRGNRFALKTEKDIDGIFGAAFAATVFSLPEGRWSEPIASSYGLHLVRVEDRRDERMPEVREARERLRKAWMAAGRREASERAIREMVDGYRVVVEGSDAFSSRQGPSGRAP